MKKNIPAFVATAFLLCVLINACSKKKDVVPPDNNDPGVAFTGFFPESAMIGDTITLTGENLDTNKNALTVAFGNAGAFIVSASKTMVKAIVPDDITEAKLNIALISGGRELYSGKTFHLKPPVITSISHKTGFEGQSIKITGKGFRYSYSFDQVAFGNIVVPKGSTKPGAGTLTIQVPSNTPAGKYPVSVAIAGLTTYAPDSFLVIVPVIKTVSPASGAQGTEMIITGENFIDPNGGKTTVLFRRWGTNDLTGLALINSITSNELRITVPGLRQGQHKVIVNVLGSYVVAVDPFNVNP